MTAIKQFLHDNHDNIGAIIIALYFLHLFEVWTR